MEKVKLTQEQADIIERIKEEQLERIIRIKKSPSTYQVRSWERPIFKLEPEEIQSALFGDYEVESEFKVGDWFVHEEEGTQRIAQVEKVAFENYWDSESVYWEEDKLCLPFSNIRHATPEEIAEEKQRRWWKKHGRSVLEIKQGDIVMGTRRRIGEVTADPKSHRHGHYTVNDAMDFSLEEFKRDNWRVVCFVENRKDVAHEI